MYNVSMKKSIAIQIKVPPTTHDKLMHFAKDVDCISETGKIKAASAVTKSLRTILNFYGNERFQKCLEEEGLNALAYVERCINRGMKESLGE